MLNVLSVRICNKECSIPHTVTPFENEKGCKLILFTPLKGLSIVFKL